MGVVEPAASRIVIVLRSGRRPGYAPGFGEFGWRHRRARHSLTAVHLGVALELMRRDVNVGD